MKKKMLNAINNQCAVVQKNIAEYFDSPKNERLIRELLKLYKLLEKYFNN